MAIMSIETIEQDEADDDKGEERKETVLEQYEKRIIAFNESYLNSKLINDPDAVDESVIPLS